MKNRIILLTVIFLILTAGCGQGKNPLDSFLSRTVEAFSPEIKEGGVVTMVTAAEEEEKGEEKDTTADTMVETSDTVEMIAEALHWTKIYYSDRGKSDPFHPLIEETEKKEKRVNVDLAELVGIIWGKNGYLALLKEGNLGYVLREGDRVVDGKVLRITNNTITFLLTRFGEQNKITLKLKKEG